MQLVLLLYGKSSNVPPASDCTWQRTPGARQALEEEAAEGRHGLEGRSTGERGPGAPSLKPSRCC